MIETLNQLDHTLMLWLNYDGGSFQDCFWFAVSYKFTWIPLYASMLFALWRLTSGRAGAVRSFLVLVLFTALIIVAADQLSSGLIKPLAQRPRPSHEPGLMDLLHYVGDYRGGRYGFVSSHAANTLALTVWLTLLLRRRALVAMLGVFCILNCYSRIYLGVHYPGDILCGSIIGALCGWGGYLLYGRFGQRLAPQSGVLTPATTSDRPITLTFALSLALIALAACFWP